VVRRGLVRKLTGVLHHMRRLLPGASLTAAVVTGVALMSVPAGAGPTVSPAALAQPVVVATGLNNPRQLSVSDADLLVAEAGSGGPDCGESGCIGTTGSVALVRQAFRARSAAPTRVVTGLLSAAAPDGGFAVGADGVAAGGLGRIFVAMTYAPPDLFPAPLPGEQAGKLLVRYLGRVRAVADVSGVETGQDPDGQGVDSNPYAVLSLPGRQLVADAAGNTVIEVRNGRPRVFAVLPDHDGNQSVPTSLAVGPDGTIYVGELNGENPGTARVLKLSPTGALLGHVGGFTTVSGVAVARDGTLHVSELFGGGDDGPPGQVSTVRPDGSRSSRPVPFPAGLALDAGGHLYVSAWSIADADGTDLGEPAISPPGQVWRLS
jgi:hypothetical protein